MVNVKFYLGNKLLKIARVYASIRITINLIAGIVFIILSYAQAKDGGVIWPYFLAGIGLFVEILFIWIFTQFIYGFGLIVCNSAYSLSEKKVVTYLDYREAKNAFANNKISKEEMDAIEKDYLWNENGYIG